MIEYITYKINLQIKASIALSYECVPQDLPKYLSLISDYIKSNDIKSYKVLINEDSFKHVPTLDEVRYIKGENPALLPALLKTLKKYNSVKAIGFDFHDYNYCNTYGIITVYGSEDDKDNAYDLCTELEKLYNIGIDTYYSEYSIVSAVFCGIDHNDWLLKKGVDW